jgi:gas vesicle protein
MNGIQKGIGFFMLGAAIGGACVALTTPMTGRRARKMIRNEVRDQIDRGSKQVSQTASQLRAAGQRMYERGGQLWQRAGAS